MSNVHINVDRRTDGRIDGRTDGQKIGRLYRTLQQAGAIIKTLQPFGQVDMSCGLTSQSTIFQLCCNVDSYQG